MHYHNLILPNNYINNEWATSKQSLAVYQKYTGELLANVSIANEKQVDMALQTSHESFKIFKKFSVEKRAAILTQLHGLLKQHKDAFADLITAEAGKPIHYAQNEVQRALHNLEDGIRQTYIFSGHQISMDYLNGKGKTAYTIRVPAGPVLGITPFNFPLNLALHKLIPAIAVGAPIILKPAPQAPLTVLALANLLKQTELPKGSVNILLTTNELTQKMLEDERLRVFSFTGSDRIGWMLKNKAYKKKVFLEMGGNAATVIDASADLKRAAKKLAYGSFLYAGQICISSQRIYVVNSVFDKFLQLFLKETSAIKSGKPFDPDVVNSSMISDNDVRRIDKWVKEAVEDGATILCGGQILDEKANIYAPTILTGTNDRMKVWQNEAFAPVVLIESAPDFKTAVRMANNSRYGLQTAVFTNNFDQVLYAQKEIEAGAVIVNDIPGFRIDSMPYGGIKDSGVGREGAYYAMHDYTDPKLMVLST